MSCKYLPLITLFFLSHDCFDSMTMAGFGCVRRKGKLIKLWKYWTSDTLLDLDYMDDLAQHGLGGTISH